MEISFKRIEGEHEFEAVKSLYLAAFPPEERRENNELMQQLYIEECAVNLIIAGKKTVGFCIIWDFTDFVYLEHFAIESALRGQGVGQRVLTLIRETFNKPVILETEPPLNEISKRRVGFYMRNGFQIIDKPYLQPSYDGIKPEVEMKLMSTKPDFSSEELDKYIALIRRKVYHEIS